MRPIIYHFTNIAPLYRNRLWKTLLGSPHFEYHFCFDKKSNAGIRSIDFSQPPYSSHPERLHDLHNIWIKQKFLVWQQGVLGRCLSTKMDMVVLLGEFMVVSNWLAALICKVRGIKVIFRGHGMYGDEKGLKLFLRTTYYKLADYHLLYERRAKNIMVRHGFDPERLHVFFNSLDYDAHKDLRPGLMSLQKADHFPFFTDPHLPTLLFVGRLTKVKQLDMLLRAVEMLNRDTQRVNLLVIGKGEERESLESWAKEHLLSGSHHFYGPCYDETVLSQLISLSDLCVSPGNVGLTAIHSLSFGTPVCTHSNFYKQMPEVEALEDGKTGLFFQQNDLEDLVRKLQGWLTDHTDDRQTVRENCFAIVDTYYNPHYQEKVLKNLSEGKRPFL
ncbi:MAG: glycosyltransferase [Sediminicola sp.]|tara:strand:+ start:13735 stop:14895 length:1161 start_codon:yes stop_codon:yes gene_type:complete